MVYHPSVDGLRAAIVEAGGLTKLANACGVSRQAVFRWRKKLPPDRVLDISRACDFKVTPHRLAPHLYPNPNDGLPVWAVEKEDA